jgi:replication factor C subunit 3/5
MEVVVINEADNLTREAQSALRRTMEKYSPNLRLILVANSSTKILAPIRSRCLLVRVAAPTKDEIVAVLNGVVQAENLGKVAPGVLEGIATESKRNLRRALLMLEAVYAQKYVHRRLSLI